MHLPQYTPKGPTLYINRNTGVYIYIERERETYKEYTNIHMRSCLTGNSRMQMRQRQDTKENARRENRLGFSPNTYK